MNRFFSFFFAFALLLLAAACTSAQTVAPTSAQLTVVPTNTVNPPTGEATATAMSTDTTTETQIPTATQTRTITPTPSITLTPTETPTPWLIWFWGLDCSTGDIVCDLANNSYVYSILSDGTGLQRIGEVSLILQVPKLPINIQPPLNEKLDYLEYSPDGKQALLLFRMHWGLYLVDLESGKFKLLHPTWYEGGSVVNAACWAPDGNSIYFLDEELVLYQINVDGSEKKELLEVSGSNSSNMRAVGKPFACSPNGQEIAFSFTTTGKPPHEKGLAILNAKTGKVNTILDDWLVELVKLAPEQP